MEYYQRYVDIYKSVSWDYEGVLRSCGTEYDDNLHVNSHKRDGNAPIVLDSDSVERA